MPPAGVVETPPDLVVTNLKVAGPGPSRSCRARRTLANTLADIAAYYWARDLRDGTFGAALKNDVPSASGANNADLDPTKDVAWWQHVNFSALSFGSDGVLDAARPEGTIGEITAGHAVLARPDQSEFPDEPKGQRRRRGRGGRPVARHGDGPRLVRLREIAGRGLVRTRQDPGRHPEPAHVARRARHSAARCSTRPTRSSSSRR